MTDKATDPLGKLRARCEAAGLNFRVGDEKHCGYIIFPHHMMREGNCWQLEVWSGSYEAAHALLDWWERRDWVKCNGDPGFVCIRGLRATVNNQVRGSCMACLPHGGQGRVPPGAKEEGDET